MVRGYAFLAVLVCGATILSFVATAVELPNDANTLLLTRFNSTMTGEDGETPAANTGTSYASGFLGEAVHTGITGSLRNAFVRMFRLDTEVTAITLEFGTYDSLELFFAMQAENWLHHHATANDPRGQRIKQEMLRVYYPKSDNHWKNMVWARANYVVDRALANIGTGPDRP